MTMTKDEALRGLTIGDCRTRREAVKTVKELLNREECEDAISRSEVIKSIDEREDVNGKVDAESVRTDIVLIPPVNPQPSGDLISRQSAIFLASDLKQDLPDDEHLTDMVMAHNEGILEYQTQLSLLPPVNPQNCDTCEVGNPCLYCRHEFEPQERSDRECKKYWM